MIERLAKERVHPAWTVPGGVNAPLDPHAREKTLAELPAAQAIVRRTIDLWKKTLDNFPNEISTFSNFPTMYAGLVGPDGSLRLYDGNLRFVGADGKNEAAYDSLPRTHIEDLPAAELAAVGRLHRRGLL